MLSYKNRLIKRKDFERIFKKGDTYKEKELILRVKKNNLSDSRFGFIVSKKVSKKASTRNLIKRRLRAIIIKKLKNIEKKQDMAFIVLPGLERRDFKELENIVNRIFLKAKIKT